MIKQRRIPERRNIPIQPSKPMVNRRVSTTDIPDIAFKMPNINGIEPNDRNEQSNVHFRDLVTEIVRRRRGSKMVFDEIEAFEERCQCLLVAFLCPTKGKQKQVEAMGRGRIGT